MRQAGVELAEHLTQAPMDVLENGAVLRDR
jgi:hypothetical protein